MSKGSEMSEDEFLRAYENELAMQRASANSMPYSPAMFGGQAKQNLVEWQLDFRPELEDIERLLRSDLLVRNEQGEEFWISNPNKDYVCFNNQGVNDIIRQIRMFLNKNKVLSNYKLEEIRPRVQMLGHELRVLVYNNYENYGIDNEYKMNNYSIIVLTITDMIESAYRRALNGEERRDLNSARIVQQNEPMLPQNINVYPMAMGGGQKKGLLSRAMPWNWGK